MILHKLFLENIISEPIIHGILNRDLLRRDGMIPNRDLPRRDGMIPMIGIRNITENGEFDLKSCEMVPPPEPRYLLHRNDILVSFEMRRLHNSTDEAKIALLNRDIEPCTFSHKLSCIRVNEKEADPRFVAHYLIWFEKNYGLKKMTVWEGPFAVIEKRSLLKMQIPLPSLETQYRIADITDFICSYRTKRTDANTKIDQLRSWFYYHIFGDPYFNPKGFPMCRLDQLVQIRPGREAVARRPVILIDTIGSVYYTDVQHHVQDSNLYLSDCNAKILPEFLVESLNITEIFQKNMKKCGNRITAQNVSSYQIAVPPIELQKEFLQAIKRLPSNSALSDQSQFFENLYRIFLDKLFSSKLTEQVILEIMDMLPKESRNTIKTIRNTDTDDD